jgi:hypothetical protein
MKGSVLSFAYGFSKNIENRLSLPSSQLAHEGFREPKGLQASHCMSNAGQPHLRANFLTGSSAVSIDSVSALLRSLSVSGSSASSQEHEYRDTDQPG